MSILVDADACPVKQIIERVAERYKINVVMYIDSSHILYSEYSQIVQVSQGKDAVDIALMNDCKNGDIVVTQDYGVASMALGRRAYAIGNSGLIYNSDNIDKLMFERFLHQKARRGGKKGGKLNNPKKRTHEDDLRFEQNLIRLCEEIK